MIPPRSAHVGADLRPSEVIDGALIVLAVTRNGEDLGAHPVRIEPGDTLLVEGPWSALDAAQRAHELLVVDSPELVRRQAVPLGAGSGMAIAVLLVMVFLLATGMVPAAVAAMLAAGAMVLGRVLTMQQAYRGISWTTVLLVAGMIPMATVVAAPTKAEAFIVAEARLGPQGTLNLQRILRIADIAVTPFDDEDAEAALEAWRLYGRGRHPAGLNLGDCYSYAAAKRAGVPLLFVGNDFAKTDVMSAL